MFRDSERPRPGASPYLRLNLSPLDRLARRPQTGAMPPTTTDAARTDDALAALASKRKPGGQATRIAEEAFTQLYERHARSLVAFLAARARRDDMEDLAQETWRRAWQRLPDGFRGGNFRAWLFEIARNLLIDHLRKRRPYPIDDDAASRLEGRPGSPDAGLIEQERAEWLRRCLAKLTSEAAALVRSRLGGEDYEGLCSRLGLSANRAYKLYHAAKGQLKDCLERTLG